MKRLQTFLSELSKKTVLSLAAAFILACFLISHVISVPLTARSRMESMLRNAGFAHTKIDDISIHLMSINAEHIKLDQYGFDEIASLQADIGWFGLLTGRDIHELKIDGVTLTRETESLSGAAQQLVNNLLHLPSYRISITNAIVDMSTNYGDIRIKAEATIDTDIQKQERVVKARVSADQYQLGFDSSWEGSLKKTGQLDLAANIVDGRINFGPLRISRFNGWLGTGIDEKGYSLQTQMEAGSATFMDIPMHNVSLVGDFDRTKSNLIFRSGVAGKPDVLFTADFMNTAREQSFSAILHGDDLGDFLTYVESLAKTPKPIRDPLKKSGEFDFSGSFQPEKRFAGGPLPFSIMLEASGRTVVDGNILFYPDTQDVRGSLETSADMASALRDYFKIPAENVKDNFIRLDGSAKTFLNTQDPAKASTDK